MTRRSRATGQCRQLKKIAEAIYEALPQTLLLFLSQKEAKKLLKHKDFAFCGKRPRALPFGNLRFFEKNRVKLLFFTNTI